mmetsp:Transcript_36216/g.117071  ORF Transcript_36216/g.117071 Transcript_36216/m.117071 type:complete len:220 (+) Transcript_36216:943-1602(+)
MQDQSGSGHSDCRRHTFWSAFCDDEHIFRSGCGGSIFNYLRVEASGPQELGPPLLDQQPRPPAQAEHRRATSEGGLPTPPAAEATFRRKISCRVERQARHREQLDQHRPLMGGEAAVRKKLRVAIAVPSLDLRMAARRDKNCIHRRQDQSSQERVCGRATEVLGHHTDSPVLLQASQQLHDPLRVVDVLHDASRMRAVESKNTLVDLDAGDRSARHQLL